MKRLLLAVLVLLAFPGLAMATDARINALGGNEKAWTVSDEVNVFSLPALLVQFPNTVWVDAGMSVPWGEPLYFPYTGNGNDPSFVPSYMRDKTGLVGLESAAGKELNGGFGVNYALGEDTVLGFYATSMSRYVSDAALIQAFDSWTETNEVTGAEREGDWAIHNADHKGTLALGHRFGSTTRFGLLLGMWGDSTEVNSPEVEKERRGGTLIDAALTVLLVSRSV